MRSTQKFYLNFSSSLKIILFVSLMTFLNSQNIEDNKKTYPSFKQYKEKFGKNYHNRKQQNKREIIYNMNIKKFIDQGCTTCQINFQTDLQIEENQKFFNLKYDQKTQYLQDLQPIQVQISHKMQNKIKIQKRLLSEQIPNSYDWRNHTNFTQVKNSGSCGASQSFVTAAFFEQEIIKAGLSDPSIDLSEMYLMNCNPENTGCNPSLVEPLLDLVIKKGGIPLESQYRFDPFSVPQKICLEKSFFNIPNITRVSYYEVKDPEQIKKIIFQKPVIASICGVDMASYSPDPNDPSSRTLRCNLHNRVKDHHVLLVGYTETEWIVKNSWGSNWGIDGYGYISNNNAEDCCIGDEIHTTGIKTPDCSVMYCQSCAEQNTCSRCEPGRYVFYNSTTGIQTCQICPDLNCQECYNYLGTCKWCSDDNSYDMRLNQCIDSSIPNCNRIQDGVCLQCKRSYRLSQNRDSCIIQCTVNNCNKCLQGPCDSCKAGFHLITPIINGNEIQLCRLNDCNVQNCSLCNQGGQCVKCKTGYLLNSITGQCYSNSLIADCIRSSSSDPNKCDICVKGKSWSWDKAICQVLPSNQNCKRHVGDCSQCKEGYLIDFKTYQCHQICKDQGCKQCLQSDIQQCITCKPGYTLNATQYFSQCVKNPCNITNCQLCNSDGSLCVKCIGFLILDLSTNQCENQCTIQNCQGCFPNDFFCSKCRQGYVLNLDDYTCVQLNITNCIQVYYPLYQQQNCLRCKQNYVVYYVQYEDLSFETKDYIKVLTLNCSFQLQNIFKFTDYFNVLILHSDYQVQNIYYLVEEYCILDCHDSDCQRCSADTPYICQQCLPFYYYTLVDGVRQCDYAPVYMQNCAVSSLNQSYCFSCKQFYARNINTGLCQLYTKNCPQMCQYCTAPAPQYNGSFNCKCKNGLLFNPITQLCTLIPLSDNNSNGGIVRSCQFPNCKECIDLPFYSKCRICNIGYYPDSSGFKCLECSVNVTDCQICFKSKCIKCKFGYKLSPSGQSCHKVQCIQKLVYDGFDCICPPGTYYINSSCSYCKQIDCSSCNQQSCFLCNQGFFLESNSCKKCQLNCKICASSANNCLECSEGFYFDEQIKQCINTPLIQKTFNISQISIVACPLNCLKCTQESKCIKCLPNYHQIEGKCYGCLQNCKTCYKGNLKICLSCHTGYTLNQIKACIKCNDSNCKNCPISPLACLSCRRGFYLDKGICKLCKVQNCLSCDYFGRCTDCQSGYTLMKDFTCQQCGGNCRSCNSSAINQCFTACNSTSYLQNNTCVSCPVQCKTCLSESVCLSCMNGYNLRNGQCSKTCQKGCYQCDQSNTAKCLKCLRGYNLQIDGTCRQDLICNDNKTCIICPMNYVLANRQCQLCQINNLCLQCSANNVSYCVQCKNGYYSFDGTCTLCNEDCSNCVSSNRCAICKDGYFKAVDSVVSNCEKCSSMCKTCVDFSQKCTSCDEGYELTVTDKCLRKAKIQGTIQLGIALSEFPSSSRLIRKSILSCIGSNYENETKHYIITKLQEGSTIVTFTVSIPDGLEETSTFEAFRTNIASLSQINGITIFSSEMNLINPNVDNNTIIFNQTIIYNDNFSSTQNDDTEKLAIILGVVIPSVVIILMILGWLIRKKFQSQKIQNDQVIPVKQLPDDSMVQTIPNFNHPIDFSIRQTPMKKIINFDQTHLQTAHIPQQSNQRLYDKNRSQSKVQIENEFTLHSPQQKFQKQQMNDSIKQFREQIIQKEKNAEQLNNLEYKINLDHNQQNPQPIIIHSQLNVNGSLQTKIQVIEDF